MSSVLLVFLAALVTALATGLGALPFASRRLRAELWLGPANAVAAGVMLGAACGLAVEGARRGAAGTLLGALAGAAFVLVDHRFVDTREALELGGLSADASKAVLIISRSSRRCCPPGSGSPAAR